MGGEREKKKTTKICNLPAAYNKYILLNLRTKKMILKYYKINIRK